MLFVGTDIVEVRRIEKLVSTKSDTFLPHIYTEPEIEYCSQKQQPSIHFAGKYAGKEAIKKAILSSKIIDTIPVNHISILNDATGIPFVELKNNIIHNTKITVSISHTDNYATATAILEITK